MTEGSSWSDDAYSIAVLLRTPKTIIVEGRTDKAVIERFLFENSMSNHEVLVDSADMFSGDAYSGLGNRDKVLKFWSSLEEDISASGKLVMLIDREWNDLDLPNYPESGWFEMTRLGDLQFQTLGHSIENYGFRLDFIADYMKHFGSSVYSEDRFNMIQERFPQIIALSASLSLCAGSFECINKMKGIFSFEDIAIGTEITLCEEFAKKMAERKIESPSVFVKEVNNLYLKIMNAPQDHLHLLSHGHLGENLIWCCIGALIISEGGDRKLSHELAFGRREERDRYFFGWLVKLPSADRRPIDSLIEVVKVT